MAGGVIGRALGADPGDFLPTSLDDSFYPFARIFNKVLKVDSGYP